MCHDIEADLEEKRRQVAASMAQLRALRAEDQLTSDLRALKEELARRGCAPNIPAAQATPSQETHRFPLGPPPANPRRKPLTNAMPLEPPSALNAPSQNGSPNTENVPPRPPTTSDATAHSAQSLDAVSSDGAAPSAPDSMARDPENRSHDEIVPANAPRATPPPVPASENASQISNEATAGMDAAAEPPIEPHNPQHRVRSVGPTFLPGP